MTPEEYYKIKGYQVLDKFDKKAPRFDYYSLLDFADSYHKKQLTIPVVGNQRELLLAYHRYLIDELSLDFGEFWVEMYIKANNCA